MIKLKDGIIPNADCSITPDRTELTDKSVCKTTPYNNTKGVAPKSQYSKKNTGSFCVKGNKNFTLTQNHSTDDKAKVDDYLLSSTKHYALKLIHEGHYHFQDIDDLQQELLLHFMRVSKRHQYDESKSSYKNWITIVVETGYKILRIKTAYKRTS